MHAMQPTTKFVNTLFYNCLLNQLSEDDEESVYSCRMGNKKVGKECKSRRFLIISIFGCCFSESNDAKTWPNLITHLNSVCYLENNMTKLLIGINYNYFLYDLTQSGKIEVWVSAFNCVSLFCFFFNHLIDSPIQSPIDKFVDFVSVRFFAHTKMIDATL